VIVSNYATSWSQRNRLGRSVYKRETSNVQNGRLIRVTKYQGDPRTAAYIVAVADPVEAIELIRSKAADPIDEIEDLGRVSDALLATLKLGTRQFVRA